MHVELGSPAQAAALVAAVEAKEVHPEGVSAKLLPVHFAAQEEAVLKKRARIAEKAEKKKEKQGVRPSY